MPLFENISVDFLHGVKLRVVCVPSWSAGLHRTGGKQNGRTKILKLRTSYVSPCEEDDVHRQYWRARRSVWEYAAGAIWWRQRGACCGDAVHNSGMELHR